MQIQVFWPCKFTSKKFCPHHQLKNWRIIVKEFIYESYRGQNFKPWTKPSVMQGIQAALSRIQVKMAVILFQKIFTTTINQFKTNGW